MLTTTHKVFKAGELVTFTEWSLGIRRTSEGETKFQHLGPKDYGIYLDCIEKSISSGLMMARIHQVLVGDEILEVIDSAIRKVERNK